MNRDRPDTKKPSLEEERQKDKTESERAEKKHREEPEDRRETARQTTPPGKGRSQ